jgi:hypothetical protein
MKKYLVLSFLAVLLLTLSCGGGGSSSGGGQAPATNGSVPELKSVAISPSSAPKSSPVQINFVFSFADSDGDLGGGTLNYSDGVSSQSMAIPSSYTGPKSGSGTGHITTTTGPNPGAYTYTVWLIDSKGNKSNTVAVIFTVV